MSSDTLMTLDQAMGDLPLKDIIKNNIVSEIAAQMMIKRLACGLSQEELANRMGLSQSMVSRYENGRENLTAETIGDILSHFGMTADLVCRPYAQSQYRDKDITDTIQPLRWKGETKDWNIAELPSVVSF